MQLTFKSSSFSSNPQAQIKVILLMQHESVLYLLKIIKIQYFLKYIFLQFLFETTIW